MPTDADVERSKRSLELAEWFRSIGDDPHECSKYGCDKPAIYFIAPQPCSPTCDHMHGAPVPMCEAHSIGHETVGDIGD